MSILEAILLVFGALVLTAGYLLPTRKKDTSELIKENVEKEIHELVEKEIEGAKDKIDDVVEETVTYSMEKAERSMERVSNEKIMAINEYSDTVLQAIHKNHDEAVFLYDMLNDKHENLMTTVSEAGKTVAEVKQTLQDAQVTAAEAQVTVAEAKEVAQETAKEVQQKAETPAGETFAPFQARVIEDFDSIIRPVEDVVPVREEEPKEKAPARKKKETEKRKTVKENDDAERISPDIQLNKGPVFGGNNNDRILEMHNAGKSNMAIAKELGLGIGEVKLVIDLYKGLS